MTCGTQGIWPSSTASATPSRTGRISAPGTSGTTAEPGSIGTEGWLGAAIRNLDAQGENVLTGVNFGRGLPRALVCKGVPVASVGNLETYGLLPDIDDENVRHHALDALGRMYGPAGGRDMVAQALSDNGAQALMGADILRTAPERYSSSVEYADTPVAQGLRNASQVMAAGLGSRIMYTQHGSFDTHSDELRAHGKLWQDASTAIADFTEDLKEHGLWDDTLVLVWSEFGRRVRDNGTGCDHGSGGIAFVFGGSVQGGLYGQYPSLARRRPLRGRHGLHQRLPLHLRHHPGPLARPGPRPHSPRPVRTVRLRRPLRPNAKAINTAGARPCSGGIYFPMGRSSRRGEDRTINKLPQNQSQHQTRNPRPTPSSPRKRGPRPSSP